MIEGSKLQIRLGKPGCGKSLDQTEQEVITHLLAGETVFCDYWINTDLPNYHYFPPTREGWESIMNERNCVVIFDEIAIIFDSRDWADEGGQLRRWLQLHRHRHVDIIANTQDISFVAKSFGVLADEWIYIEKAPYHPIITKILELLRIEIPIRLQKTYLTIQELKKMAAGWELGEQIEISRDNSEIVKYKPSKLVHSELNDIKEEIIHRYCPKCASRQGEMIKKGLESKVATQLGQYWVLNNKEFCPKHKEQELELRFSGIYDTDYEPEVEEVQVEWRPYIDSPKGYTKVIYKGLLSDRQAEQKKSFKKSID